MVGLRRLELPTSRLSGVCSNQLSYKPIEMDEPILCKYPDLSRIMGKKIYFPTDNIEFN